MTLPKCTYDFSIQTPSSQLRDAVRARGENLLKTGAGAESNSFGSALIIALMPRLQLYTEKKTSFPANNVYKRSTILGLPGLQIKDILSKLITALAAILRVYCEEPHIPTQSGRMGKYSSSRYSNVYI